MSFFFQRQLLWLKKALNDQPLGENQAPNQVPSFLLPCVDGFGWSRFQESRWEVYDSAVGVDEVKPSISEAWPDLKNTGTHGQCPRGVHRLILEMHSEHDDSATPRPVWNVVSNGGTVNDVQIRIPSDNTSGTLIWKVPAAIIRPVLLVPGDTVIGRCRFIAVTSKVTMRLRYVDLEEGEYLHGP